MTTPSGMPGKVPGRCPACAAAVSLEPPQRYGETTCPQCGKRLWFARQRDGVWFHDADRAAAIRERVRAIVGHNLRIEPAAVNDSTTFMEDVGADTLDIVELVMELEEEFKISIPDEHAERILTVGDLVDYLLRQLG
jgi:acyl carrier protein